MEHPGRVAGLLRGQILVSMRGKVVGAKTVPQSVGLARHPRLLAQLDEVLLPRDFVQRADFAAGEAAELDQPCGQGGDNLDKPALACLGLASGHFDMAPHAPHVHPVKPEQFLRAQPDQPGEGHYCPHRSFRRFEQGSQFVGRVKLDLGIVRVLGAHVIGFAQAVSHGEVVFADGPLQELRMAAR